MRFLIILGLSGALLLAGGLSYAVAAPGAGGLIASKPFGKDKAALPRLAGTSAAAQRINRALAAADKADRTDDCLRQRAVDTTLVGTRYVNFVVSLATHCEGGTTDLATKVLGFDLATGEPVDWTRLLPPGFHGSDAEAGLYLKALKQDDPDDAAQCGDFARNSAFQVWPDAKAGGIAFQPGAGGVPSAEAGCVLSEVIPTAKMRQLGANPALLKDLDAAHAGRGR